jgi:hypothetical protein
MPLPKPARRPVTEQEKLKPRKKKLGLRKKKLKPDLKS